MSLRIQVINATQRVRFEHAAGPLELGRGPQRECPRLRIEDPTVSRDQLRIEVLPNRRVRVENLSLRRSVLTDGADEIGVGQARELEPPLQLQVGKTQLLIEHGPSASAMAWPEPTPPSGTMAPRESLQAKLTRRNAELHGDAVGLEGLVYLEPPAERPRRGARLETPAGSSSSSVSDSLADWLETIIELQQAAAGSPEFYQHTAQALMDLVGLDLGLVLLRQDGAWTVVGSAVSDHRVSIAFSRTLLNHVLLHGRTIYRDRGQEPLPTESMSLANIEAAVVAPIFGLRGDVVGALYGVRIQRIPIAQGGIAPLEAQLVELLAAAVGSNLARSTAIRTRVQFEQFFSPELVQELERDPHLLEGRSEEVTILFSDLRGFTDLSQRLGAHKTCRMVRDMMECLSERIVEQGGAIVDYAGDGILAMWNAPAKQADHAARACRAALAMLGEVPSLNARWGAEAAGSLALGISLNTGEAQVGNTGSSRKFKYGPHGHTVNLASRIQEATKKLGLPLLLAGRTREQLPPEFLVRRLGHVRLPGVGEPVLLHELHGEQADPSWLAQCQTYERALTLYESGHWSQACQALMPLLSSAEEQGQYDTPTLKLMRRAWECLESRPEPFEPIIELCTISGS